jgi:hypothetical protein
MIRSDYLSIRSEGHTESFRVRSAKATPQTAPGFAAARARAAWLVDRDLQAVRSAELPLSRRPRTWPEAISGDQSAWRTSPQRICTKCDLRSGHRMAGQLSPGARYTQRDLRHQCRTSAPPRGSQIDPHGPGVSRPRLCQSRCDRRRYGRVLSRCRRSAVEPGGAK